MRLAYYGGQISPNIVKTPEGYLICKNVPIGRLGEMQYLAEELGLTTDSPDPVRVMRDADALFELAAIASFEGKPVTDGHPPDDVESHNYSNYSKGHAQNVRRGAGADADKMMADLVITDPNLINVVENNLRREVSSGYSCNYVQNDDGTYSQRQIRGNHIAIVDEGRAGKSVCIKDSVPAAVSKPIQYGRRERLMSKKTDKISSILNLFGRSVRDAKTTDELEDMAKDAAAAIESMQSGEEKEPVKDEAFAGEGELVSVIKELTAAVKGMQKTSDAEVPPVVAKEKEEEVQVEDKKVKDGDDVISAIKNLLAQHQAKEPNGEVDDPIVAMIEELTGKDVDEDGDMQDEDMAEQEEALTVNAETMDEVGSDNSVLESAAKDAAIAMLKNARPAIAAIKDSAERKRVTDALLKSVKDQIGSKGTMANIMKATAGAARKNANDAKYNSGVLDIDAQQAAYDKLNPHMKKGAK